jgi:hypothetical protein
MVLVLNKKKHGRSLIAAIDRAASEWRLAGGQRVGLNQSTDGCLKQIGGGLHHRSEGWIPVILVPIDMLKQRVNQIYGGDAIPGGVVDDVKCRNRFIVGIVDVDVIWRGQDGS